MRATIKIKNDQEALEFTNSFMLRQLFVMSSSHQTGNDVATRTYHVELQPIPDPAVPKEPSNNELFWQTYRQIMTSHCNFEVKIEVMKMMLDKGWVLPVKVSTP